MPSSTAGHAPVHFHRSPLEVHDLPHHSSAVSFTTHAYTMQCQGEEYVHSTRSVAFLSAAHATLPADGLGFSCRVKHGGCSKYTDCWSSELAPCGHRLPAEAGWAVHSSRRPGAAHAAIHADLAGLRNSINLACACQTSLRLASYLTVPAVILHACTT